MTATLATHPDLEQIWRWLADVPDPEIPVISVVDLGIVRDLQWLSGLDSVSGDSVLDDSGPELLIAITPTYSGCPATEVIAKDIETALRTHGIQKIRLENRLSPPWTTDWISDEGRKKLHAYGIAPPVERAAARARNAEIARIRNRVQPTVQCPRCGSNKTARISEFGSTPCKAQYRCQDCLEPFDYFKCL